LAESIYARILATRKLCGRQRQIAIPFIDRVAGVMDEFRTTIATFVNRVGSSDAHSRQLSESPFDSSGHVIAQFLRSLQGSLDPDNFYLAGRDLSGRFAVTSRSHQAALVTGQHAPKDRHRTFLRLRMRTAKADQSLGTMFSSRQGS
jgi:hypothetical protein